jgi:hypothetical protein
VFHTQSPFGEIANPNSHNITQHFLPLLKAGEGAISKPNICPNVVLKNKKSLEIN